MTILELLQRAATLPVAKLVAVLEDVAADGGEFGPVARELLNSLNGAVSAADLAAIGAAIPGELLNIAQGKLEPREHPSDGA